MNQGVLLVKAIKFDLLKMRELLNKVKKTSEFGISCCMKPIWLSFRI